jgi:hypothetical protein
MKNSHSFYANNRCVMTELDQAIAKAFGSEGKQDDVNKVYLTLLRSVLIIPVEKASVIANADEEPFKPLFAKLEDKYFMLAFDTLERLQAWGHEQLDMLDYVEITGRDLIAGINEGVYLCLNVGATYYKEFSPEEVTQLKKVVARIDQLKS